MQRSGEGGICSVNEFVDLPWASGFNKSAPAFGDSESQGPAPQAHTSCLCWGYVKLAALSPVVAQIGDLRMDCWAEARPPHAYADPCDWGSGRRRGTNVSPTLRL